MNLAPQLLGALFILSAACATTAVDRTGASGADAGGTGTVLGQNDASTTNTGTRNGAVYAHSAKTLYRVDIGAGTTQVHKVGNFSGTKESLVDLALDTNSKAYGVSYNSLFEVNVDTAACTKIASGVFPNSLSFVPAGTLDPSVEALVGYLGSDYVRIGLDGTVTTVRAKALGNGLESSGDIVAVSGKAFLTVRASSGCDNASCETCVNQDCIVQINPATGEVLKFRGGINRSSVFGLAFWAGKAYGFSDGGSVFAVDLESDVPTTTSIPFVDGTTPPNFYGAGSTTSAPPSSVQ